MSEQVWIGVDLDGTLAVYDYWRGIEHIGAPIPMMVERVRDWLLQGREVRIFTARMANDNPGLVVKTIWNWLKAQGLPPLHVTNIKDFSMVALWDDRAVQVETNTGLIVGNSNPMRSNPLC